jgi:hypothetical protein
VSLDGTPLPAGVAHHLFVTVADEPAAVGAVSGR